MTALSSSSPAARGRRGSTADGTDAAAPAGTAGSKESGGMGNTASDSGPTAGSATKPPAMMAAADFSSASTLVLYKDRLRWLRSRGLPVPPPTLTAQEETEIRECFEMLDDQGTGVACVMH